MRILDRRGKKQTLSIMGDKVSAWDLDRLKQDIQKYTEMRNNLSATIKKMERAKEHADKTLQNIQHEDNVWKDRCLQMQEQNQKLQDELEEQQNDLIKAQGEASGEQETLSEVPDSGLEGMTDFTLRQLQKRLEKEKTETEWKLKEYGWRLDQASSALCRAEEDKKAILTQIGHAVVKMKDMQKPKDLVKTKSCELTPANNANQ